MLLDSHNGYPGYDIKLPIYALVAQLEEQLTFNQRAGSSNLLGRTIGQKRLAALFENRITYF